MMNISFGFVMGLLSVCAEDSAVFASPNIPHSYDLPIVTSPDSIQSVSAIVTTALKYLNTPYRYNGRNEPPRLRNLDCLGLLFITLQENYGIPWRKWSYVPSKLIGQIAPDSTQRDTLILDDYEGHLEDVVKDLKPGDFLFLLGPTPLVGDKPILKNCRDEDLYVWHTGIYSGSGNIIHASPFDDNNGKSVHKVIEENLLDFMTRINFEGFVKASFSAKK